MIGFVVSCIAMFLVVAVSVGLAFVKYRLPNKWSYEELIIAWCIFTGMMVIVSLIVMGSESHYQMMLNMEALRAK